MASSALPDDSINIETSTSTEDAIEKALREDPELNDIINKLDNVVTIDPDHELNIDEDCYTVDSDTVSNSSSFKDNDQENGELSSSSAKNSPHMTKKNGAATDTSPNNRNGNGISQSSSSSSVTSTNGNSRESPLSRHSPSKDSVASRDSTKSDGKKSSSSSMKSRSGSLKNPLKALKKLTKFADKDDDEKTKKPRPNSEFTAVVVDRLPQVFVVKYMGFREVHGMFGLHHVRRPVDEMVKEVKTSIESDTQKELPLVYAVVSPKGLDLREHKRNKIKDGFPAGLMPIDFISYGVQDIKYWRVFTCIVVRELSSRTRSASCHAFLCDSAHSGRKMALALGAAFNVYSKKLKNAGKAHNFQVELRPPDELADAVDAECEA